MKYIADFKRVGRNTLIFDSCSPSTSIYYLGSWYTAHELETVKKIKNVFHLYVDDFISSVESFYID